MLILTFKSYIKTYKWGQGKIPGVNLTTGPGQLFEALRLEVFKNWKRLKPKTGDNYLYPYTLMGIIALSIIALISTLNNQEHLEGYNLQLIYQ